MPYTRKWTPEEEAYLIANYRELPYVTLGKHLDRSWKAVADHRMTLGLPAKLPRFPVDFHYFDSIDTHEKAYLLGFIAADGWLGTPSGNHHVLTLRIQAKDVSVVKMLRDAIAPSKQIGIDDKAARLDVRMDDHGYGVLSRRDGITVDRKATFTKPLSIPGHLSPSFWLGYFDGDGSLSQSARGHWMWSLCGSKDLMAEFVSEIAGMIISSPVSRPHRKVSWLYYVWIQRLDDIRIVDNWLHQSELGLKRKQLPADACHPSEVVG